MSTIVRCAACLMRCVPNDHAAGWGAGLSGLRLHRHAQGMAALAMLVQQTLGHDPFCGTVFAFRGRRSGLIKLLWHDGVGMCLFIKRLERGQFIWPMSAAGTVSLSAGQLSTLLEGCEWRASARNLRPELAG